jgi:hypothetical protein
MVDTQLPAGELNSAARRLSDEEYVTDAAGIRRVDEREQAMLDHIDDKVRFDSHLRYRAALPVCAREHLHGEASYPPSQSSFRTASKMARSSVSPRRLRGCSRGAT